MNVDSLKAKIRNYAKSKNIPAQVLLQSYMFERFLERISISEYKDKFILKGGMLIAAIVGIETRTTKDLDITIRAYPLDEQHIRLAVDEICGIKLDDDIVFRSLGIESIRKDDKYGGLRVSLEAVYGTVITHLSLDVTAGDMITPYAVRRSFISTLDEKKKIEMWAYNVETVLAEKVETILRRGVFNTRMRDFYDVYILATTQEWDDGIFRQAIGATSKHRETASQIVDVEGILRSIQDSEEVISNWRKYQQEYSYARKISFEDVINKLKEILVHGAVHIINDD